MTTATTGLDFLAAIIVVIIATISALTLFGTGIMMAVGAIFSNRPLVTSWPENEQHAFAPFERRSTGSNSQAWTFSLIGAVIMTVAVTGIYFGVTPELRNMTKDMNMSNLTKKRPAVAPKAEAPATPDAPKPDTAPPAPATPPTPATPAAPKP